MAEELWKYLQHVPNPTKKPNPVIKRKSEVTDKEVLNLTGGLFPLKLVDQAKDVSIIISRTCQYKKVSLGCMLPFAKGTLLSGLSTNG